MVQHPPVHVEDQRLRAGAVGQLAHVLGEQEVQPAQPVVARYREHAAVRAVDDRGGPGHGSLLGKEVAAVGGNSGVDIGNRGIGGVEISHWMSRLRQSRQCPERATCVTSNANPLSSASRSASCVMTSVETSVTAPQPWHTRWTCSCSCTE